jgi:hypothetical protein
MDTDFMHFVNKQKEKFFQLKDNIHLIIIANKSSIDSYSYIINQTMDAVLKVCDKYNIEYEYFTDENTFMRKMLTESYSGDKLLFVYNRSINGTIKARRMLIPVFCDYNRFKHLGNDSYRMGLLCNKFHYYSLLKSLNIPVADFWCYQHGIGWINPQPPHGCKVIAKLVNENNALSLSESSVFIYSPDFDTLIDELSQKYNQAVVLQKFIHGYEVSVPIFVADQTIYVPEIIGSIVDGDKRYGSRFISESTLKGRIQNDYKGKYYQFSTINSSVSENIKQDSRKIVKALGINSFSRFDLRIDDSFSYYFNDLGSIPGILPSSSYAYLFDLYNFTYEDFMITTIVMDI